MARSSTQFFASAQANEWVKIGTELDANVSIHSGLAAGFPVAEFLNIAFSSAEPVGNDFISFNSIADLVISDNDSNIWIQLGTDVDVPTSIKVSFGTTRISLVR